MSFRFFNSTGQEQIINSVADLPVGAIIDSALPNAPTGWLLCDGSSISRTGFPELFAAIGTFYGTVDANTFTLPDLTGQIIYARPYSLRTSNGLYVDDNSITSAKILDGTIATADIANGAITSAKIADGAVTTAKLEDSGWLQVGAAGQPTFDNGWSAFGGYTVKFRKVGPVVSISGFAAGGTVGARIFNLPAGYRPFQNIRIASDSNGAYTYIGVQADGLVLNNIGNTLVALSVSFTIA